MKRVLMVSALMLCTSAAFAEPTAVLKVNGTLTNASCAVTLGNGGVIDYGYIHLGELSATENNTIGDKSIPVTIDCTAKTKVGFTMQDNRTSSVAKVPVTTEGNKNHTVSYYLYGVGTTTDNVKIGNYGLWITDMQADGVTVDAINKNQDWGDARWQKSDIPRSDAFNTVSFAETGTLTPMALKTATFNIVTNLAIKDTTTLAITDDTPLDGETTMTLVYL